MVASKFESFNSDLQNKAKLFKTLGHPARIQILQFLAQTRKCFTGDISDNFPLTRTTINQHIRELKNQALS